jgi:hypothetical protein
MNLKFVTLLASVLLLAACSGAPAELAAPLTAPSDSGVGETAVQPPALSYETQVDDQGAVSVAVTPLKLNETGSSLEFDVAMDTHSVDLSMDLATLATLTTDSGRSVSATLWDAAPGGHHVSGVLSFPATVDSASLLEGASRLTLTIRNVDAPQRVFAWNLSN